MLRNAGPGTSATFRELNNLDRSLFLAPIDDDFIGGALNPMWVTRTGTNGSCLISDPNVVRGVLRMATGADAGATMALNGAQVALGQRPYQADMGSLYVECRLRMSAITAVSVFVGFTDQFVALEAPIISAASADTLTTNATDAVGWMFDTSMATDNWWLTGVAADVDATAENGAVAPTANTYETLRVELTTAGVANFWRNGAQVGGAMSAAVTATVALTPVVAAFSRGATSRNIDLDYIQVGCKR